MTNETTQPAPQPEAPTRSSSSAGDIIDLRALIGFLRRRLRVMFSVFVLVLLAAIVAYMMAPRTYVASSSVVLDRNKLNVVAEVQEVAGDPILDSAAVDTEVQVLKSRALAERVVNALQLDKNPAFNPTLGNIKQGVDIKGSIKKLIGGTSSSEVAATPADVHNAVVNRVLAGQSVKRVGLTYTIQISYTAASAKTAALIANTYADQYVASQLDTKVNATVSASNMLRDRIADLRVQVEAAEAAVQQYRAANGLLASSSDQSLTQQEISSLNGQLAQARANQAEQEARLTTARRQLAGGSTGEDLGEALNSDVITRLRDRRAEISRQVVDMQSRYGPRHPELVKAQSQLADIDGQIQGEVRRIISNLEAQAQVARQRTASLAGSLGASRGTLTANSNAQVRLNELERNAESVRTLYQSFLDRYKETTVQQGTERPEARVIAKAPVPRKPASPNPALFLGGGFVAALGAALALAVLLEIMENGVATARDVERHLGVRALASVPDLQSTVDGKDRKRAIDPATYVVDKPLSGFAESFRSLRASLSYARTDRPIQVIAITSALPGEGKTTTSLCLARSIARSGGSVVVVDADVRRRSVNRALKTEAKTGLLEVLRGEVTLDEALIKDSGSDAAVLLAGELGDGEPLQTSAMDDLLVELRKRFATVILDTAPVLPIAETRVLAAKADAVLFLVRWRKTPAQAAIAAINQLRSTDAFIAGAAMTQVDLREQARSGYGDPGFYYNAYKSYYAS